MNYQEAKNILESQTAAKEILDRYEKLASAHLQYGFTTRGEFITALQELENLSSKRGRLTAEDRKAIGVAISEGKTAAAIAKQFNISQPYVYVLKRASKTKKK